MINQGGYLSSNMSPATPRKVVGTPLKKIGQSVSRMGHLGNSKAKQTDHYKKVNAQRFTKEQIRSGGAAIMKAYEKSKKNNTLGVGFQ